MKIRYILEGILLTILVATLIHIITINKISLETIHAKEIPTIDEKFKSLDDRIKNIKDETCRISFDLMNNRIQNTYFKENITLKEYYDAYNQDNKTILDYYDDILNNCKLENDDEIYLLVLSSLNYPNSIKNRYDIRYEFNIRDTFNRDNIYSSSDEIGTYTTKILEIKVIDRLLDEVLS